MRASGIQASQSIFCIFRFRPQPVRSIDRSLTTTSTCQRSPQGRGSRSSKSKGSRVQHSLAKRSKPIQLGQPTRRGRPSGVPTAQSKIEQKHLKSVISKRLKLLSEWTAKSEFKVEVGLVEETAGTRTEEFQQKTQKLLEDLPDDLGNTRDSTLLALRAAYVADGNSGIDAYLKFALQAHVGNHSFTESDLVNQKKLADLRYPHEWYPTTRSLQRTIHLHVGPTNSGKTYHALKRLEQASSGLYAGPLRLLAHEVYTRLNAIGKTCNLLTGDERISHDSRDQAEPPMCSCTVEMVPVNRTLDVAVVDEIQMIGHDQRGWAWTQAVLAIQAKELHLCGEERAVPIIQEIAAAIGDKLHIHHYKRLSPLRTMSNSLNGKLKDLRKGDCVVVFSRMGIHSLKKDIEKATKKRVAVVYGSLPPETRAQQARLFNDPHNDYDILVASDAIGMGLNLSIKRIIFESTIRHNGTRYATLSVSDIKQIAGRAGRYRTVADVHQGTNQAQIEDNVDKEREAPPIKPSHSTNLGLVTSLEHIDLPVIQRAMGSDAIPLETAGILPPSSLLIQFATYFSPQTPFSYILQRLHEISVMHSRYHLCGLREWIAVADVIQHVKNLTIPDRIIFCAAPVAMRDPYGLVMVSVFAKCVADHTSGGLLDIPELKLGVLDAPMTADMSYLRDLEGLHKSLVLYLWLSYRFTGVFTSPAMAACAKGLVEEKIDQALAMVASNEKYKERVKKAKEKAILKSFQEFVKAKRENSLGQSSDSAVSKSGDQSPIPHKGGDMERLPLDEDKFESSGEEIQSVLNNGEVDDRGHIGLDDISDILDLSLPEDDKPMIDPRSSLQQFPKAPIIDVFHGNRNSNDQAPPARATTTSV